MFNRNKREYLKAIEKIKVPDIIGAENNKKKKIIFQRKLLQQLVFVLFLL